MSEAYEFTDLCSKAFRNCSSTFCHYALENLFFQGGRIIRPLDKGTVIKEKVKNVSDEED